MNQKSSIIYGFLSVLFLLQNVSAYSISRNDMQNIPLTPATIFIFFIIIVIVIALVFKYTSRRHGLDKIRKEIEDEESEREYFES